MSGQRKMNLDENRLGMRESETVADQSRHGVPRSVFIGHAGQLEFPDARDQKLGLVSKTDCSLLPLVFLRNSAVLTIAIGLDRKLVLGFQWPLGWPVVDVQTLPTETRGFRRHPPDVCPPFCNEVSLRNRVEFRDDVESRSCQRSFCWPAIDTDSPQSGSVAREPTS